MLSTHSPCPSGHSHPPQMNLNLLCNKNCCRFSQVNVSIRQGVTAGSVFLLSPTLQICPTQVCPHSLSSPLLLSLSHSSLSPLSICACQLVKSYVSSKKKELKAGYVFALLFLCPCLCPFPNPPLGSCHSALKDF